MVFISMTTLAVLLALFSSFFFPAHAQTLVLEYAKNTDGSLHSNHVSLIACPGPVNCSIDLFNSIPEIKTIDLTSFDIINMSFVDQFLEVPNYNPLVSDEDYNKMLASYEISNEKMRENVKVLKEVIEDNHATLFTIAAGNGYLIAFGYTEGIALGKNKMVYPAVLNHSNTLTVTSIHTPKLSSDKLSNYVIADYANYGLEHVDLAATVSPNHKGQLIGGTSFSAPVVAKLAREVKNELGDLAPHVIKEIMMRSCYVKNIDQAIAASLELKENGKKSLLYLAQYHRSRKKRIELQKELGDIMLVRCGGFLYPKLLRSCISKIKTGSDIKSACIAAHKEILGTSIKKLLIFWNLRNI